MNRISKKKKQSLHDVAEQVRLWRVARGISQQNLARALKTGQSTISRIETGKLDLTVSKLLQISEHIGVAPAQLLGK